MSILMNKLRRVPSLKLTALNTDSIQFEIDEDKVPLAEEILKEWEKRYRLELERDDTIKLVMRDINNYIEILETPKGKEVKFKGSCFASCPEIIIEKDNRIVTKYKPNFKNNNLVIVSEALAKYLLFEIPIEKTIENCNDLRKFFMTSHLGSTYEKCVQESPNGDILLQRNNRIYNGKKPSGKIIKVKYDGKRDSLANQPPNPLIDNGNKCTIEDIDKSWYIKLATQWANDFLGIKRLTAYKKSELLILAEENGIIVDRKVKKEELIKLIEERNEREKMATKVEKDVKDVPAMNIYKKIAEMTKEIRSHEFVLDCILPSSLGNNEYASIGQYYELLHDLCDKYNLLFQWEVMNIDSFEKDVFKPVGKLPQHLSTVTCRATFYDLDSVMGLDGELSTISYLALASGSDTLDKGASSASTLAFRNWFDKNFTPNYLNKCKEEVSSTDDIKTEAPKVPTYIPHEKKEEIKKEVVESSASVKADEDDSKEVIDKIMLVREKLGDESWGANTLDKIIKGEVTPADLLQISLKVDNKLDSLGDK